MSEQQGVPADGGQGADAAAAAAAQAAAASAAAGDTPPEPFYKSFKDAELRGYAEVKGFKDAETLAGSYRSLEKMRGVPVERLLTLPENMDDAEAMAPIRERLGFAPPKEASEYGFATLEGVDPARAKVLEGLAHKHGIPAKMASAVFADILAADIATMEAQNAAYQEEVAVERGKLQASLGDKFDGFVEEARRAARRYGLEQADIEALENAIGYEKTMRFMNNVGRTTGEAGFVEGDKRVNVAMTPEGAKARIAELSSNEDWRTRYLSGDKAAQAEMQRLQQIAHPGMTQ